MAPSKRELDSLIALARRVVPILKRVRAAAYPLSHDEDDAIVDFCHAITRYDNAKPTILPPGTVAVDRDRLERLIAYVATDRAYFAATTVDEVNAATRPLLVARAALRPGDLAALDPTAAAPPVVSQDETP